MSVDAVRSLHPDYFLAAFARVDGFDGLMILCILINADFPPASASGAFPIQIIHGKPIAPSAAHRNAILAPLRNQVELVRE
ncbi:MAG: hypothetical protein ABSH38_16565 [Verrucomicrobiota bacterium]|jgi:hypothetical protein